MKFENIKILMEQHKELLDVLDKENYKIEIQEDCLVTKKHPYPNVEVKIIFTQDIVKIKSYMFRKPFTYYGSYTTQIYEFSGKETNKNNVLKFLPENNKLLYLKQILLYQNSYIKKFTEEFLENSRELLMVSKDLLPTIEKILEEMEE